MSNSDTEPSMPSGDREIRSEYSDALGPLFAQLGISLFVSTYDAGKLVVINGCQNKLKFSFHNFERAMGIAAGAGRLAIGGKDWVYFLNNAPELAPQITPAGTHDACYLTRASQYTGDISVHELAWGKQELWVVNTLFNCLCHMSSSYNFVPRWRPPFIDTLAAEDRCHLNGLAMENGMPKYVTVLGQTNTKGGWRPNKATNGCILSVETGAVVVHGFAMPHSPRVYQDRLWVCDSGNGAFVCIHPNQANKEAVVQLPGYPRGLAFVERYAFVGLSKIRETAVFGELPISESSEPLKCGIAIVDIVEQKMMGLIEFHGGIDEIFDVQLLVGMRSPILSGPYAALDGTSPIWLVPSS
ncbi:MAG: TIGR03032 family protein [Moorea sp. SIO3C2]|nr:TIGR03032 family protein [Moorena sp. SIO3C2]